MASQHHYYDMLGVARDATVEEVKKAFKRAALQHHPDKGGDPERFKECNAAVEVLSDERQRAAYDLQLLRSRSRDGHGTADERAARRASSVQPPPAAPAPSAGERSQSYRPAKPRDSVEIPADPSGLSVRELKDLLTQLGIRFDGCTEKAELLALLKPAGASAQATRGPRTPRQAPKAEGPALARPLRIKVMSLGSGGVGKSCLIKRYCEGRFVQKYITTIGVDYGVKPCTILGQATKVNFFDTSGGPEFRDIREEFYSNVSGVVLVYDVTDKRSFSDITRCLEEAREHRCLMSSKDRPGEQGPPFAILCANKSDQGRRVVGTNEGERLAAEHGFRYFETSAATGDQVSEAFEHLFEKIISHHSEVRKRLNMSGG